MRLNLPPVLVAAGALIAREAYEAVAAPAGAARQAVRLGHHNRVAFTGELPQLFQLSRLAGLLTCSLNG